MDKVHSSVISGRCQKANVPPNASSAGVFDGSGHLQWSSGPSYWSADPRPLTLNPSFHSGRDINRLQPVVASSFPPHPTHPTVHSEQSTPFSNKMDSATTQVNQSTFFVFNITRNELFCVLCSIWQQVWLWRSAIRSILTWSAAVDGPSTQWWNRLALASIFPTRIASPVKRSPIKSSFVDRSPMLKLPVNAFE